MNYKNQDKALEIQNLEIQIQQKNNEYKKVVENLNLEVKKGRISALVGESGSGKSITALSIMGIQDAQIKITQGEIYIDQIDITKLSKKEHRKICTKNAGMIFQNSLNSLNPLYKVGNQIIDCIITKQKMSKKQACQKAKESLGKMQFENPEEIMNKYPFELSGGMCQRIVISMATILNPPLLIADEPTTALDVTVQAEILKQIKYMSEENNTGVLFITHDLGVVAEIADEVFVMKNGTIVETQDVYKIFHSPSHPYTKHLIQSAL